MIIKVKLGNNSKIGSLMGEPFFLRNSEENKLQIEFETDTPRILIVSLRNGEKCKQLIVRDKTFVVPPELMCEGQLEIIACLYDRKVVMKRWVCEPISICRVREESFEVYSVFQKMTERIDSLKAQLHAVEQENQALKTQIDELWQTVEQ